MLKIFTDFHHAGLLQSFILLFEKRLGGQVYRPIGRDWFDQGYWKVYDHPATVEQFLGIGGNTPDGTPRLNDVDAYNSIGQVIDGIFNCYDIDSGKTNKAITLQRFMNTKIDIVIASIPAHVEPFKKLCEQHPNRPKLIFQIGNAWTNEAAMAPNIMASAIINDIPDHVNFISYHQEFDTKIFSPFTKIISDGDQLTFPGKSVKSFVNVFDSQGHFANDWKLFTNVERHMPDWSFKVHGGQCRDGAVGPSEVLAQTMRDARFIWHTKAGGDGYGHVIHNAPAVARPLIVKKEYYQGKMAEPLLIDGQTCIAIDGLNYQQVIHKILHYSEPERYAKMSRSAYENFTRVVDFDKEELAIKQFLAKLI